MNIILSGVNEICIFTNIILSVRNEYCIFINIIISGTTEIWIFANILHSGATETWIFMNILSSVGADRYKTLFFALKTPYFGCKSFIEGLEESLFNCFLRLEASFFQKNNTFTPCFGLKTPLTDNKNGGNTHDEDRSICHG